MIHMAVFLWENHQQAWGRGAGGGADRGLGDLQAGDSLGKSVKDVRATSQAAGLEECRLQKVWLDPAGHWPGGERPVGYLTLEMGVEFKRLCLGGLGLPDAKHPFP